MRLQAGAFSAVGVAAVHDDAGFQAGRLQLFFHGDDADRVVVGAGPAAAQDDMAQPVAPGTHHAREAVFVYAEEMMGAARGNDRVDGRS